MRRSDQPLRRTPSPAGRADGTLARGLDRVARRRRSARRRTVCVHAGADMAPWYEGALPTGMFGVRWVSQDNNDSFYTVLNAVNNADSATDLAAPS